MAEQETAGVVEWNLSETFGGRVTTVELEAGLEATDWSVFAGKTVKLRGCLPVWAFLKAATRLVETAERIEWVDYGGSAVTIWQRRTRNG